MKTITAFNNLRNFSIKVDRMQASFRVEKKEDMQRLLIAKDYFVSMEELKIPISLGVLAKSFEQESQITTKCEEELSEVFQTLSELSFEVSVSMEKLLPFFEYYQMIAETLMSLYQNDPNYEFSIKSKKTIDTMIALIKNDLKYMFFIKKAIIYFETYILSKMTKEELVPEFENINLN